MRNITPIAIRYADTDMMGVVYHANYLLYMEDARTAFLDVIGCPYKLIEEAGLMSPVLSLECNYGTPLRYGENAVMVTWVSKSTGTKTVYNYEVYREGANFAEEKPLFSAKSTHCIVRRQDFVPVSIKRAFPQLLEAYDRVVESD